MFNRETLRIAIMEKYECPRGTPTEQQLARIIEEALTLGREITEDDWERIVLENVPGAGGWGYHSEDFSDLTALLYDDDA